MTGVPYCAQIIETVNSWFVPELLVTITRHTWTKD